MTDETAFDLRAFREKHGFSQTDLAELWDVTQNMISKFEVADELPAIARLAGQALQRELEGEPEAAVQPEPVDTQPLLDRIAELEGIVATLNADKSALLEANKQRDKAAPVEAKEEKPRTRRLGRAPGALVHGIKSGDG